MTVSKRLRFEILRRDNHTCRYCGRSAPEVKITIDHVIPEALGGGDDPSNLVTACSDCNGGKSSVPADAPLVADVADDAVRWEAAIREAAREMAAEDAELERVCGVVRDAWGRRYIPDDYRSSLYPLLKAGVTQEDLLAMVPVALSARNVDDRWAYFCGCCWNRLTERQKRASEILGRQPAPSAADGLWTRWTEQELADVVSSAENTASRLLHQESVDSAFCIHRSWGAGTCGDALCVMRRATALFWMADSVLLKQMRGNEIADAAEALLDA